MEPKRPTAGGLVLRPKTIRHIMPLGPRVLVRVLPEDNISEAGLYLPPGAKEKHQEALYGEVIEVARAAPEDPKEDGFGANVAGVPLGARVLFAKLAGVAVPWDDNLRVLESKEILATVDEVSEEDLA